MADSSATLFVPRPSDRLDSPARPSGRRTWAPEPASPPMLFGGLPLALPSFGGSESSSRQGKLEGRLLPRKAEDDPVESERRRTNSELRYWKRKQGYMV